MTWSRQEPGWYTSELGEIRRALNGWWFFSSASRPEYSGPAWPTLREAQWWAEACANLAKG